MAGPRHLTPSPSDKIRLSTVFNESCLNIHLDTFIYTLYIDIYLGVLFLMYGIKSGSLTVYNLGGHGRCVDSIVKDSSPHEFPVPCVQWWRVHLECDRLDFDP